MAQLTKYYKGEAKIVNDLYEGAARQRDMPRAYLGMSEIGKPCCRALWYRFRGFSPLPFDGRIIMLFRLGDAVEAQIIDWLEIAGYNVYGLQDGFSDFDGFFKGHCDGIVKGVTSQDHVLEIKSYNKTRFDKLKRMGVAESDPQYYDQCQCYMGYSGLERALFVAQCKDTSEIHAERLYFMAERFRALKEKAKYIVMSNEAPPQHNTEDSLECQWCDFRVQCWRPGESIVEHKCGTCSYMAWDGLKRYCSHPDHNFYLQRFDGCPDWLDMFEKMDVSPIKRHSPESPSSARR